MGGDPPSLFFCLTHCAALESRPRGALSSVQWKGLYAKDPQPVKLRVSPRC